MHCDFDGDILGVVGVEELNDGFGGQGRLAGVYAELRGGGGLKDDFQLIRVSEDLLKVGEERFHNRA